MKRLYLMVMIMLTMFLAACGGSDQKRTTEEVTTEEATTEEATTEATLSEEEQFAVDYLLAFAQLYKNPHSIKIYNVWVYEDKYQSGKYYITYSLSAQNELGGTVESTKGNTFPVAHTQSDINDAYINEGILGQGYFWGYHTDAKEKGVELDAEKIQAAFEKAYK